MVLQHDGVRTGEEKIGWNTVAVFDRGSNGLRPHNGASCIVESEAGGGWLIDVRHDELRRRLSILKCGGMG
jgi:hypothetical protein